MTSNNISIVQWTSSINTATLIPSIVDLHIACIQHDNSMMRFHPPFDGPKRAQMETFWKARFTSAINKGIVILVGFSSPSPHTPSEEDQPTFCGIGALSLENTDTRPFSAEIELVMVSPLHQRQGIARKIMEALEGVAREECRTLLRLGTTKDSPADVYLYPRLGYVKAGEIPGYGYEPNTMRSRDMVMYYKHLV